MEPTNKDRAAAIQQLARLLIFCVSCRRYQSTNPYGLPEIKAALEFLAREVGATSYLDVHLEHLAGENYTPPEDQ